MFFNKKNKKIKKNKGSFLIELLVAFAIISISMTVIVDAYLTTQGSYRDSSDRTKLASAITYLFEDITREARVSNNYSYDTENHIFSLTHVKGLNNQNADTIEYFTDTSNDGNTYIRKKITNEDSTAGPNLPITMENGIEITNFDVTVFPTDTDNHRPIRALISVSAKIEGKDETEITLQTSITERTQYK